MNDGLFAFNALSESDSLLEGQSAVPGKKATIHQFTGARHARPFAQADTDYIVPLLRERLRRAESELSSVDAMLALHPDPILVLDHRGAVVRSNAAARVMFGNDLLMRNLTTALDDKRVTAAAERVLAHGDAETVDFQLSRPTDRYFRAHLQLLPDYLGLNPNVLLTITDLTEIKRVEQLRADFVANASHELRTPLAILLGFIETLTGSAADDPEAQQRFLPIMHQQADRMARLVDDLLSLSRIELTEHELPATQVRIADVVGPVARALGLRAAERGMQIELAIAPDLPLIFGAPDELAQVFQNLIDNAIKYARPNTAITVTAKMSKKLPGGVAVRVRDRGDGIAKRHLSRLTERFYRGDAGRSGDVSGTGLGLAIVKHIVNHHHGLLDIESKVGRGTSFTVHLGAALPEPAGFPIAAIPSPENETRQVRDPDTMSVRN